MEGRVGSWIEEEDMSGRVRGGGFPPTSATAIYRAACFPAPARGSAPPRKGHPLAVVQRRQAAATRRAGAGREGKGGGEGTATPHLLGLLTLGIQIMEGIVIVIQYQRRGACSTAQRSAREGARAFQGTSGALGCDTQSTAASSNGETCVGRSRECCKGAASNGAHSQGGSE